MTYRFVENQDLTFGRKTSNASEQENSRSGILAEVRSLGPLRGLIKFCDIASTRLVDTLNDFRRIKETNEDLDVMPTHFFKKLHLQELEKCTSLSSYEVVNRTSTGIADVRYFCGENQLKLTCSVNLTEEDAPYGTCYFASTYGWYASNHQPTRKKTSTT